MARTRSCGKFLSSQPTLAVWHDHFCLTEALPFRRNRPTRILTIELQLLRCFVFFLKNLATLMLPSLKMMSANNIEPCGPFNWDLNAGNTEQPEC